MPEMENGLEVRSLKMRAIAYYRHSLKSQADESFALQRDQVRSWASELDVEIIHEFYDAGCSMDDCDERPAFTEMMLPLVYDELRKPAAAKISHEKPGQTLQATALVHDAYMRLVDQSTSQEGDNRRHFFAAAAEAMRRMLVENARRKKRLRHGGGQKRVAFEELPSADDHDPDVILTIDQSLREMAEEDEVAAAVVKFHFFAGLTLDETAEALGISRATAYRQWSYARSWLKLKLGDRRQLF